MRQPTAVSPCPPTQASLARSTRVLQLYRDSPPQHLPVRPLNDGPKIDPCVSQRSQPRAAAHRCVALSAHSGIPRQIDPRFAALSRQPTAASPCPPTQRATQNQPVCFAAIHPPREPTAASPCPPTQASSPGRPTFCSSIATAHRSVALSAHPCIPRQIDLRFAALIATATAASPCQASLARSTRVLQLYRYSPPQRRPVRPLRHPRQIDPRFAALSRQPTAASPCPATQRATQNQPVCFPAIHPPREPTAASPCPPTQASSPDRAAFCSSIATPHRSVALSTRSASDAKSTRVFRSHPPTTRAHRRLALPAHPGIPRQIDPRFAAINPPPQPTLVSAHSPQTNRCFAAIAPPPYPAITPHPSATRRPIDPFRPIC